MTQIDLRSDTVTQPTEAMREAMAAAQVGDDGREGDPTTRRLEEMTADMLGKEAGLFVVSGTGSNLLALLAGTSGRGTVLAHEKAHILRTEMGGISTLAGLFSQAVPGARGAMDLDALRAEIHPELAVGHLPTVMVEVETTHNAAGGCTLPLGHLAAVRDLAGEYDIPVHMDGARLFNAAVAQNVPVREIACYADTVGVCLSKGLSAPVGSVLCGPADIIEKARALRRMIGGTLRQSGVLAAAGIVALETMIGRLADDHDHAKRLAGILHGVDPDLVDPETVETNIIMVNLETSGRDAAWFAGELAGRGIWTMSAPSPVMRLVTHRGISFIDVDAAGEIIGGLWREQVPG